MKKIFLFSYVLSINYSSANEWQEDWIQAVEYCEDKQYEKAMNYFDLAIENIEKEEKTTHSHVYVNRARLKMLLGKDREALSDLDIALENENIEYQDKLKALVSRLIVRART